MPAKDLQRWNQDGSNMQAGLEAAGYEVDHQYASNDIATQVRQAIIKRIRRAYRLCVKRWKI